MEVVVAEVAAWSLTTLSFVVVYRTTTMSDYYEVIKTKSDTKTYLSHGSNTLSWDAAITVGSQRASLVSSIKKTAS